MKRCSHCKELKTDRSFWKDKKSKDGLCFQCKECKRKINHQSQLKHNVLSGKHRYYERLYASGLQKCSKCSEVKKLSEFTTDKRRKSGKNSHCKECERKRFNRGVRHQRRDQIFSLLDQGFKSSEIAKELRISPSVVCYWKKKYIAQPDRVESRF